VSVFFVTVNKIGFKTGFTSNAATLAVVVNICDSNIVYLLSSPSSAYLLLSSAFSCVF